MGNETGKRYYWLKLHDDFFNELHIKKLRRAEDGWRMIAVYQMMLLRAIRADGMLIFGGVEEDLTSELALAFDVDEETVRATLDYLESRGLAECSGEDYFLPEAASNTGSESAGAQRVREHRRRAKALQIDGEEPHCNVETLQRNAGVMDLKRARNAEKEIETEKDKRDRDREETRERERGRVREGETASASAKAAECAAVAPFTAEGVPPSASSARLPAVKAGECLGNIDESVITGRERTEAFHLRERCPEGADEASSVSAAPSARSGCALPPSEEGGGVRGNAEDDGGRDNGSIPYADASCRRRGTSEGDAPPSSDTPSRESRPGVISPSVSDAVNAVLDSSLLRVSRGRTPSVPSASPPISFPVKGKACAYGEYANVLLTEAEYAKVKAEFPRDWRARIDGLSAYIASTGKKYKSHFATIRNWARMERERGPTRAAVGVSDNPFLDIARDEGLI
ncbi:MAG: phage replisome organizer N-terminal domain-containing protein [Clostridia bacterium]|nr:phage replisome organizer N-terminal domain-containing protein [Clostridia bacterium]